MRRPFTVRASTNIAASSQRSPMAARCCTTAFCRSARASRSRSSASKAACSRRFTKKRVPSPSSKRVRSRRASSCATRFSAAAATPRSAARRHAEIASSTSTRRPPERLRGQRHEAVAPPHRTPLLHRRAHRRRHRKAPPAGALVVALSSRTHKNREPEQRRCMCVERPAPARTAVRPRPLPPSRGAHGPGAPGCPTHSQQAYEQRVAAPHRLLGRTSKTTHGSAPHAKRRTKRGPSAPEWSR